MIPALPPALHFACPGAIGQPTGGYRYDAAILRGLAAAGRAPVLHELAGRFPCADAAARAAAAACLAAARDAVLVIDGLALPAFAGMLPGPARAVIALIHHPLALETGLSVAARRHFAALEPVLVAACAGTIVTSPATIPAIRAMGVPASCIRAVIPAVPRHPAPPRRRRGRLRLLCVASLTPRKGHRLLLAALSRLRDRAWRIDCVGPRHYDRREAGRILVARTARGLAGRVTMTGAVPAAALARRYAAADLFVLPSLFEGYGMAFAEAIATGLPVVGARAGAVPSTVPSGAGLLVRPGDAAALARALRRLIDAPPALARLARGARARGRALPDWDAQARRFAAALDALAPP
jgi:glycosyltransferase involved in cell wall biosynthesis